MATRQDFCNGVIADYKHHSVYIGTGNGERVMSLTIGQIFNMEKTYGRRDKDGNPLWYSDTARDLEFIAKCFRNKLNMDEASAEDCSGLPVHILREEKIIKPGADYNCRMFQEKCKEVSLREVKPSDFVFDKKMSGGKSTAGHMGVVVEIKNGETPIVIESQGRDKGVVCRSIYDGNWAVGGRLPDDWFDDDFLILTRELYYREGNLMKGDDVREVQDQLKLAGYNCGASDGVYGKKTKTAVQAFQIEHDLTADGIVGEKTAKALGFIWEG